MPELESYSAYSSSSLSFRENYSANSTRSNLPGTGRLVGTLIDKLGLWVEDQILYILHRRGFGVKALRERIDGKIKDSLGESPSVWSKIDSNSKLERLSDSLDYDCRKLIKYAKSWSTPTQTLALDHIIELITRYPILRDVFSKSDNIKKIQSIRDARSHKVSYYLQHIRKLCSRDLLCLEENSFSKLVQNLQFSTGSEDDGEHVQETFMSLLDSCRHPNQSYIALRYSTTALLHRKLSLEGSDSSNEKFWSDVSRLVVELVSTPYMPNDKVGFDMLSAAVLSSHPQHPLVQDEDDPFYDLVNTLRSEEYKNIYESAHGKAEELWINRDPLLLPNEQGN